MFSMFSITKKRIFVVAAVCFVGLGLGGLYTSKVSADAKPVSSHSKVVSEANKTPIEDIETLIKQKGTEYNSQDSSVEITEPEFSIDGGKTWMSEAEYEPINKAIEESILKNSQGPVARPSETKKDEAEYSLDNGKTWLTQAEFDEKSQ